jgi:TonB family protein
MQRHRHLPKCAQAVLSPLLILFLLTAAGPTNLSASASTLVPMQAGPDWELFAPDDEEFSLLTPISPSVFEQSCMGYTFKEQGEPVLSKQSYSVYVNQFVFVVESYLARRPERLLNDFVDYYYPNQSQRFEGGQINGFRGKRYRIENLDIYHEVYFLLTSKHFYVLRVAANDKSNPFIMRLLSSFKIREDRSTTGPAVVSVVKENGSVTDDRSQSLVYNLKEVTRKPIVIWKPSPAYTNEARKNQRMGRVLLNAVLDSSGQVRVLETIKPLRDGLTERAIGAANNIKFLPAEKDGKIVSVRIKLEYNFNLY